MTSEHANPYAAPDSNLDTPAQSGDMNWFEIYVDVIKRYFEFQGRATRTEYWVFTFMSTVVSIVLMVIGILTKTNDIAGNIYSLAVFIPSIAVGVRRLHDTDHSGWWLLLPLVNLIFLVQDTQTGPNRFGQDPKRDQIRYASSSGEKYLLPVGRSSWAIAAGYLALFSVLLIPAPIALFCGIMALRDIASHPEKIGKPRAWFGIIMGGVMMALFAIIMLKR